METAIVLFTRDLRRHDNPALHLACTRARRVAPLFVVDPAIAGHRHPRRRYVPGLAGLNTACIQAPWTLPPAHRGQLGYPDPIAELS